MISTKNHAWDINIVALIFILALHSSAIASEINSTNLPLKESPAEAIGKYNDEKEILLNEIKNFPSKEEPRTKLAQIYYKLGGLSKANTAKELNYNHCMTHTTRAIEINPESAVGFFFRALCRGKIGQLKGMFKSLGTLRPFKKDMETALKLDPATSHGGPNRGLGMMYNQLPFFMGGSNKKSIYHLKEAVKIAPDYWENHLFLGEVYYDNSDYNLAMDSLRNVLKYTEANKDDPKLKTKRQKAEELMKKIDEKMN
ncbi:MAG: tetratricopeptide repeat protein [Nitrospinales bacterium]